MTEVINGMTLAELQQTFAKSDLEAHGGSREVMEAAQRLAAWDNFIRRGGSLQDLPEDLVSLLAPRFQTENSGMK